MTSGEDYVDFAGCVEFGSLGMQVRAPAAAASVVRLGGLGKCLTKLLARRFQGKQRTEIARARVDPDQVVGVDR